MPPREAGSRSYCRLTGIEIAIWMACPISSATRPLAAGVRETQAATKETPPSEINQLSKNFYDRSGDQLARTSGSASLTVIITVPVVSSPRLPARPAICVYSPAMISRKFRPSCFFIPEKTTHFAGILTPWEHDDRSEGRANEKEGVWGGLVGQVVQTRDILVSAEVVGVWKHTMAKVSVANSTLTKPLANRISTI